MPHAVEASASLNKQVSFTTNSGPTATLFTGTKPTEVPKWGNSPPTFVLDLNYTATVGSERLCRVPCGVVPH